MPPASRLSFRPSAQPVSSNADLALVLLGPSTAMSHLWAQIRRLAPYTRTTLLTGSPDCGQEAIAHLLLDLSPAPQRPFLALSTSEAEDQLTRPPTTCALPHEAFLYLPEVDRLSTVAQHGLVRLLRQRRSRAFSLVATTAEDLKTLVSMGTFSAELAEVLCTVRVLVPALRERAEDLPMLLSQLLTMRCQAAGHSIPQFSEELLHAAMQHAWPGNLQELSSAADDLLANAKGGRELGVADLLKALGAAQLQRPNSAPTRMVTLDTVVQEHICAILRACRGNKLRAAEVLGISRSTLYRMLDNGRESSPMSLAS